MKTHNHPCLWVKNHVQPYSQPMNRWDMVQFDHLSHLLVLRNSNLSLLVCLHFLLLLKVLHNHSLHNRFHILLLHLPHHFFLILHLPPRIRFMAYPGNHRLLNAASHRCQDWALEHSLRVLTLLVFGIRVLQWFFELSYSFEWFRFYLSFDSCWCHLLRPRCFAMN